MIHTMYDMKNRYLLDTQDKSEIQGWMHIKSLTKESPFSLIIANPQLDSKGCTLSIVFLKTNAKTPSQLNAGPKACKSTNSRYPMNLPFPNSPTQLLRNDTFGHHADPFPTLFATYRTVEVLVNKIDISNAQNALIKNTGHNLGCIRG